MARGKLIYKKAEEKKSRETVPQLKGRVELNMQTRGYIISTFVNTYSSGPGRVRLKIVVKKISQSAPDYGDMIQCICIEA